jgi:(2Fe-2S) ferredoxin
MLPLERHVFVCVNERDPDDPRGCCGAKGSREVQSRLKQLVAEAGLRGRVRINSAGCLDQCARGVTVVVYPEAVWYGGVTPEDAEELFREHVLHGRPVERLRLDSMRPRPDGEPSRRP